MTDKSLAIGAEYSGTYREKLPSFFLLNMHNRLAPIRDLLTQILSASYSYIILDLFFLGPSIVSICTNRRAIAWLSPLLIGLVANLIIVLLFAFGSIDAGPLALERVAYTIRFYGIYPFLIVLGACLNLDDKKLTEFFASFFWTLTIAITIGVLQFSMYQLFGYEIMDRIYSDEFVSDMSQGLTAFEYDWVAYRINSIFNFVTTYAGFCFLYFVVCLSAFVRTKSVKYNFGCILAILAQITSGSRGSVIVAGMCVIIYFNAIRRLVLAAPALLIFSLYIAPQLIADVFSLTREHSLFVAATLSEAIDMTEPISFRAGMDSNFIANYYQNLGLHIESWVGKVLVEFGYFYACIVLLAAFLMAVYGFFVLAKSFWHRTDDSIWRSSVAAYVAVNLAFSVKGAALELYPAAPYVFILLGLLVGSRLLDNKAQLGLLPRENAKPQTASRYRRLNKDERFPVGPELT